MSKHTPGPWVVEVKESSGPRLERGIVGIGIVDKKGRRIASVAVRHDPRELPNARLIAAAPIMLDALRAVEFSDIGGDGVGYEVCPLCGGASPYDDSAPSIAQLGHYPDCLIGKSLKACAQR